jgi:hypothetical protein
MTTPGGVLGADVASLEQFARTLTATAQAFTERATQLTSQLDSVAWNGRYAEQFRGEWNGQARQNLNTIVQMLNEASRQAAQHAAAQRAVSGN